MGQKSSNLTIYNLITRDSIEQQIAAGLLVKQNLFESVLDGGSTTDYVDFSSKGRSQFIEQLEAFVNLPEEETGEDYTSFDSREETVEYEDGFSEDFGRVIADYTDAYEPQAITAEATGQQAAKPDEGESEADDLEQVMASGMQFLAGLFKMSTGKNLELGDQQISVNKETGEVTMKFKLPVK